jgi:hypothetical protein
MMRLRAVRPLAAMLALAFAAQSASAQIDEADRLQRCANNQAALDAIAHPPADSAIWSDEKIARARTAVQGLRRELAAWRQASINSMVSRRGVDDPALVAQAASSSAVMIALGQPFGIYCRQGDTDCALRIQGALERQIDAAVAALPQRQMIERQAEVFRSNRVALRCDAGIANIAGIWSGSNGLTYQIGQSGGTIGWQVASIAETGAGIIQDTRVAASWNGNWGPGSATGSVVAGPDGVARRIEWSNGVVFSR